MPSYAQRSFAAGELAPTLHSRSDLPFYRLGAKRMENFYVGRDGSAKNRTGTKFIGEIKDSHDDVRVHEFRFSDTQAYVIEIGTGYFRLWTQGARLVIAPGSISAWANMANYVVGNVVGETVSGFTDYWYCVADHAGASGVNDPDTAAGRKYFWYNLSVDGNGDVIFELPTPYAQSDLADLSFSQSGDIVTVCHPNHLPHELTRLGAASWTMKPGVYKPAMPAPTDFEASGGDTGDFDIGYMVTAVQKDTFVESLPAARPSGSYFSALLPSSYGEDTTDNIVLTGAFTLAGFESGDLISLNTVQPTNAGEADQVAVDIFEGSHWVVGEDTVSSAELLDSSGLRPYPVLTPGGTGDAPDMDCFVSKVGDVLESVKIPVQATAGTHISLTWSAPTNAAGDDVTPLEYNVYRSISGSRFFYLGSTTGTSFTDDGTREEDESLTPPVYRYPFYGGARPRTSSFYQQRQVFDGGDMQPRRLRFSVAGDFKSHFARSPIEDSDGIDYTMAAREAFSISRFVPLEDLLVLTEGGVFALRGSDGTVKPTNLTSTVANYRGAKPMDPVVIAGRVLFVQARGYKVIEMDFQASGGGVGGYNDRDLTALNPVLFDGYTISDWAYAEVPDSLLWICRSDGTLLCLTHVAENGIFAWSRHITGASGEFLSVTTIPESTRDVPYFIVKREIDGSPVYYLETMEERHHDSEVASIDESFYVDSALSYDGVNADGSTTLTVTGGTTWAAGETGLTVTASAALFTFPGSADTGHQYVIYDSAGNAGEIKITASTSTTVATCEVVQDIPLSLRGAASTTTWLRKIFAFSGLDHLEGETVTGLGDGVVLPEKVVTSGSVDYTSEGVPYGMVTIGLPITAYIQTMPIDFDADGTSGLGAVKKTPMGATLAMFNSRGVRAGYSLASGSLFDFSYDNIEAERSASDTSVSTGKFRVRFGSLPTRDGSIFLVQNQPLPAQIGAYFLDYTIGEMD